MAIEKPNDEQQLRKPPFSEEAETGTLGAILFDMKWIEPCVELRLCEQDFYLPNHRLVYRAMLKLYRTGKPFDTILVSDQLRQSGDLERIGDATFLNRLVERCVVPQHVEHYAKIVRAKSQLRRVIHAARVAEGLAYEDEADSLNVIAQAQKTMFDLSEVNAEDATLCDAINETMEVWTNAASGKRNTLPCFLPSVDKMLNGFRPGKPYYIGAEPAFGKTTWITNQLEFWAMITGIPVAMASIEMTQAEVVGRILARRARLSTFNLDGGKEQGRDGKSPITMLWDEAEQFIDEDGNQKVPLFINDRHMNVDELVSWTRMMVRKEKIQALVVDYLQILRAPDMVRGTIRERTIYVVQTITKLCKDLNIVVLAASQITSAARKDKEKTPSYNDMREAGNIGEDAYGAMMLYEREGIAWCDVQKNRGGQTGRREVVFKKHEQQWEEKRYEETVDDFDSSYTD